MGGQGNASAHVTPLDAARLVVAVNGSRLVKDSVDTVRRYGGTIPLREKLRNPYEGISIPGLAELEQNHSLLDALAAIISAAAAGFLLPSLNADYPLTSIRLSMAIPNTSGSIQIYQERPPGSCLVRYQRSLSGEPRPLADAGKAAFRRWREMEDAAKPAEITEDTDNRGRRIISEINAEVFLMLGNLLRSPAKDISLNVGAGRG
jgi:hypothetical protein